MEKILVDVPLLSSQIVSDIFSLPPLKTPSLAGITYHFIHLLGFLIAIPFCTLITHLRVSRSY